MTYDPRAYWDNRAPRPGTEGQQKWMIDHIRDLRPASILEFGCGCGWLTEDLLAFHVPIHAFDISVKMIEAARLHLPSLRF